MTRRGKSASGGGILLGAAGGLLLASGGLLGGYFLQVQSASASGEPAVVAPGEPAGDAQRAVIETAAARFLDRPVTVVVGDAKLTTTWRELGAEVDPDTVGLEAARVARS